jgi:DNA gyrase inhibitor GyrI
MEVITEQMPACVIAYLRTVGPYGINNVRLMEELKKWAEINHLLNEDSIILGIAQDNPMTTKPENCRYDTCIVISTNYSFRSQNENKIKITDTFNQY